MKGRIQAAYDQSVRAIDQATRNLKERDQDDVYGRVLNEMESRLDEETGFGHDDEYNDDPDDVEDQDEW